MKQNSRRWIAGLLLCGAATTAGVGCSTPAYTAKERANAIGRTMSLEWKMAQDDIDHALLLRPVTNLTVWHVRGIGP